MNTTMTLSEAIRLGAMLLPQGFGPNSMYSPTSSCALAAAADAIGLDRTTSGRVYEDLKSRFPLLSQALSAGNGYPSDVRVVIDCIWNMNDSHRFTREEIADWVERMERGTDVSAQAPTSAVMVLA